MNKVVAQSEIKQRKSPKQPVLDEGQVLLLHEKISNKMTEIQTGLEKLRQKHTVLSAPKTQKEFYSRPVDLLEVYCEEDSQLTHRVNQSGGVALRFTKRDGDLSTEMGINKLWTWVEAYEPEHIWVAPECRLWGSFSRFNMGRSDTTKEKILNQRKHDLCHLKLCNDLYNHQVARGKHFHLEQPMGSEMTKQPQLSDAMTGTLPAFFDMCQAGKLKSPNKEKFLKKRTQVRTTSRRVHQLLHHVNCDGNHEHQPIKGSVRDGNHKWVRLSAYAAAYTAVFARRVAQGLYESRCSNEPPLIVEELLVGEELENTSEKKKRPLAHEVLELRKCRKRHDGKGPPTSADIAYDMNKSFGDHPDLRAALVDLEKGVPRVGNSYCHAGDPRLEKLQKLIPDVDIKFVLACRGTERHRVPTSAPPRDDIPLRKTIYVHRETGEAVDTGPFEAWTELPKLQQTRKAGPAKISFGIFGKHRRQGFGSGGSDDEDMDVVHPQRGFGLGQRVDQPEKGDVPMPQCTESGTFPTPEDQLEMLEKGWPPKAVPTHGPAFLSLEPQQRSDLLRLHQNLGHPDPARLNRLLVSQGADPRVIAGALDMQCDVCLETQPKPKLAHPAAIHGDLDFNDVVGADGAYWRSSGGVTYHFMHFIDEGTLFHVGQMSGRTTEDQISTFEQAWLQWAGPCKTLYLDPAGEHVSPKWNQYLQKENIQVVMAAGDSHWQIGRAEIHGKIVKDMLTRMDREEPIRSVGEFQRCLRQVFAAKNSLSRAKGFTPEQALLGKARSLPASLTSDDCSSAHALADSDTPEGVKFRESLQRREQARRAFIQADNDSSCRRALLRRSRPGTVEFEKGDWVLYWKKIPGNPRGARGRWHGPAQVITVEQRRVVWISHGGYLIRASPQHLRPASLREYRALPRGDDGQVRDEEIGPRTRNFHALSDVPPMDEEEYEPSIAPSNVGPPSLF